MFPSGTPATATTWGRGVPSLLARPASLRRLKACRVVLLAARAVPRDGERLSRNRNQENCWDLITRAALRAVVCPEGRQGKEKTRGRSEAAEKLTRRHFLGTQLPNLRPPQSWPGKGKGGWWLFETRLGYCGFNKKSNFPFWNLFSFLGTFKNYNGTRRQVTRVVADLYVFLMSLSHYVYGV